ncbi:MAG TPA: hypothetical protein PKZ80_06055 [Thermoleophilia bacterium]|jgi:heme exporter protein D|nr:hypothetical protein [Actinomycetota bacterium]HOU28599.1 hypothetical protein [Thermoleophilia bacterium]HQJ26781.1 hypothetical protein [Thermoleophilia bacterium]
MSRCCRRSGQDGFIREVVWVVVVLAVIGIVVLDAIAVFKAHQVGNDAAEAAREARTEYAQSLDLVAAKLAAMQYLDKSGIEMLDFKSVQAGSGAVKFTVTGQAVADTYAFRFLGVIPALKDWVERVTHPVGTGSAE